MQTYSRSEKPSQTAFPIAKAGIPFIGVAAFATAVLALLEIASLALLGLAATLFICYFFRDPDRLIPDTDDGIVSPADGKVLKVENVGPNRFINDPCKKISIFMSVFNVHVNRVPLDGRITKIEYYPGKFFSANLDKASRDNEHNAVHLETEQGQAICFVQIAGLVARRIICNVQVEDNVKQGQRFGMICFGSRLDVYLPESAQPTVAVGEMVSAGTSLIGKLS